MSPEACPPLKTLFVLSRVTETSAPYNEHCLPAAARRKIAIVTFYPSQLTPSPHIPYYPGNGTVGGFLRAIHSALSEHDFNLLHAHSPVVGLLSLLALRLNRRRRPVTIFTVHNSFSNFSIRNRLLLVPIFATYQRVVCCGRKSGVSFPGIYRSLARAGLHAIPNGVNLTRLDEISTSQPNSVSHKRFTVASVGRLIDIKNPLTVLKAFGEAQPLEGELVFIGDGYLRGRLSSQLESLKLSGRVQLLGSMARNDVYRWLARSDLFISASRGEGLPVAALEAMASRCPVVLSDIEPHREIADGTDFIPLVAPEDVGGFAREIARFARLRRSEREKIGESCRALVERRFSLERMQRRYEQVYVQGLAAA